MMGGVQDKIPVITMQEALLRRDEFTVFIFDEADELIVD